jgi:predicted outer membrane repeat protein
MVSQATTSKRSFPMTTRTWIRRLFAPAPRTVRRRLAVRPRLEALEDRWLPSTVWYVNGSDTTGSNNGTSWANAFTSLQTALRDAHSGDQIWVAKGTYKPTTSTDRTASFVLDAGVAVYGGFAGTETALSQRNVATNGTELSGDIGTVGDNSDNSYHVVTSSGLDKTAILDGFTITGGNANGDFRQNQQYGGGMYSSGSPTLSNLTFSDNTASFLGGGMYTSDSPTLTNVTFSDNSAGSGGGLYNDGGSATLTNVTFSGNSASDGSGGGMFIFASSPTLTNVTFSGNSAHNSGGGLYCDKSSSPTLTNVTFSGNSAPNGGGMANYQSSPTLINVTFSGNSAGNPRSDGGGGGLFNTDGSLPTLTNCILWGDRDPSGREIVDDPSQLTSPSSSTVSYSDVQGGWSGAGSKDINQDPLFVDAKTGNLHLQPGSPAIDTGTNTYPATGPNLVPSFDLDGNPRPVDGGTGKGAITDMGAYEYAPTAKPTVTSSDPANITATSATLGGTVTDDGGLSISAQGVVYSTSSTNLQLGQSGVTPLPASTGSGPFSVNASNLASSTIYYYAAYATNSDGTSYSSTASFNTLAPPTSSVTALPASSPTSFTVSWSGQDNSGSGLAGYSVYFSDNGGAFMPLLTNTQQTSTTFTGQAGHTYGFYSVATDNLGDVQPTPTAAQASTLVLSNQTITFTAPTSPIGFAPNETVTLSATGGGSGNAVVFSIDKSSTGTGMITGNVLTVTGAGSIVIDANQAGSSTYSAAPQVQQTLVVLPPGATLQGGVLYLVGGNTNDTVNIKHVGTSNTGMTGIQVQGQLNGVNFNNTYNNIPPNYPIPTSIYIAGFNGNDNITEENSLAIPVVAVEGNGNDNIQLGQGNNSVTVGSGNDTVTLGNGNNVVVTGNGHNTIQAGNGNNLIVGGLGNHTIQVGNARNILIDGSVTANTAALTQALADWVASGKSDAATIRTLLGTVTLNTTNANTLLAGSGLDWFFAKYAKDTLNNKPTDSLN